jgi:hypothetical protein
MKCNKAYRLKRLPAKLPNSDAIGLQGHIPRPGRCDAENSQSSSSGGKSRPRERVSCLTAQS